MKTTRQIAFEILLRIQRDDAYSNISIDAGIEYYQMDERNSSLLSALIYGTLERILTIDYNLLLYLKDPINKLQPEILTVLRLGTCQLLFMDKIPVSAAVNESVNIIKQTKYKFAAGLVNAVLRKIAQNGLILPDSINNQVNYLSVKYSCPEWLILLWMKSYGVDNTVRILEHSLKRAPAYIRVNSLATNTENLTKKLKDDGLEAQPCENYENTLIVKKSGSVEKLESFHLGLFHFQDISSQIFCQAIRAKPGDVILDLCAAPGGKSFTLAQTVGESGKVYAYDLYESRVNLINKGAERLGLSNIQANVGDACVYDRNQDKVDIVICDVPCSGFGVIRRKPEIRYKKPENIDKLPDLQYFILCNASNYVKVGGTLAYSTCTLNPEENEDVCEKFLLEHNNYIAIDDQGDNLPKSKFVTLLPHINDSDGFFYALFKRME